MYKLNKKTIGSIIVAGVISLVGTSCNRVEIENPPEIIEETMEEPQIDENPTISLDQDLNGCVVYKMAIRKQLNKESNEWSDWEETTLYYLGPATEDYNKIIQISETEELKMNVYGVINNEFTEKDFEVTRKTYHEQAYDEGKWIDIPEEVVMLENGKLPPKRCLIRWVLDKTENEVRVPKTSTVDYYTKNIKYLKTEVKADGTIEKTIRIKNVDLDYELPEDTEQEQYEMIEEEQVMKPYLQLMQGYEVTVEDGDYVWTPTTTFTTITNVPNFDLYYLPAGMYVKSNALVLEKNENSKVLTIAKK